MKRTVLAIAAVLLASLLVDRWMAWPGEGWALVMMVADLVAAAVILIRPAGRMQSLVGLTYLLQIGVHAGRILNGDNADMNFYYWGLSGLALLQLALVGGWWISDWAARRRLVPGSRPAASAAHRQSLEG